MGVRGMQQRQVMETRALERAAFHPAGFESRTPSVAQPSDQGTNSRIPSGHRRTGLYSVEELSSLAPINNVDRNVQQNPGYASRGNGYWNTNSSSLSPHARSFVPRSSSMHINALPAPSLHGNLPQAPYMYGPTQLPNMYNAGDHVPVEHPYEAMGPGDTEIFPAFGQDHEFAAHLERYGLTIDDLYANSNPTLEQIQDTDRIVQRVYRDIQAERERCRIVSSLGLHHRALNLILVKQIWFLAILNTITSMVYHQQISALASRDMVIHLRGHLHRFQRMIGSSVDHTWAWIDEISAPEVPCSWARGM